MPGKERTGGVSGGASCAWAIAAGTSPPGIRAANGIAGADRRGHAREPGAAEKAAPSRADSPSEH